MIIDTNILLRFLLKEKHIESTQLFKEAYELIVTDAIIAEAVYVLCGNTYGYSKQNATLAIEAVLSRKNVTHNTLADSSYLVLYRESNLDLADCYLIALALKTKQELKTFDKQMLKTYQKLKTN